MLANWKPNVDVKKLDDLVYVFFSNFEHLILIKQKPKNHKKLPQTLR